MYSGGIIVARIMEHLSWFAFCQSVIVNMCKRLQIGERLHTALQILNLATFEKRA